MNRLFSRLLDRTTPVDSNQQRTHLNELNQSLHIDKQSKLSEKFGFITTPTSNDNVKFGLANDTAGQKNLPYDYNLDDNNITHTATKSLKIAGGHYLSYITQNIHDITTAASTRTFIGNNSTNLTTALNNISGNLSEPNMETLTSVGGGSNSTNNTHAETQDWMDMPKLDNFVDVFSLCCSVAVILGGLVPYIPQYLKIKRSSNNDGFSTYVCLTLLLANILRIAFWFGHHFELPLLIQSFVMIFGMLAMMEICVRVRTKNSPYIITAINGRPHSSRPRYSVIGKTSESNHSDSVNPQNDSSSESSPIYSVTPIRSTSSSSSSLPPNIGAPLHSPVPAASTLTIPQSQLVTTPCSQRESVSIESIGDFYSPHLEPSTQYNTYDGNSQSFIDRESPILDSILASSSIEDSQNYHQQTIQSSGTESQSIEHSYSNGYISKQRRHRLALVKWLYARQFWDWDDLLNYIKFLSLFTITLSLITYALLDNHLYVETLGFVAVFTESLLGLPQLFYNYVKKSTRGMSVEMVVMWFSGDLFKSMYFILRHAPVQFIICGAIQVCVDILILFQVFWYRRPNVTYSKLPKST